MARLLGPLLLAASLLTSVEARAEGDPVRGEVAFQKCYACHSVIPGETGLTGPNLYDVIGRPVASVADFEYSKPLKALPECGVPVWTEEALDAFVQSPEDFAPGTSMTFVGMASAEERADLLAYLRRVAER